MFARVLFISVLLIGTLLQAAPAAEKHSIYTPYQLSASLLVAYAEQLKDQADATMKEEAEKKYLLTYDIYIKARSYAILNKIFFVLSVLFGLAVLLWPSLSIVFKERLSRWEWVKSATVQTTVTGIAALMFAIYTDYKDKQTYAETLMRYVVYSKADAASLSLGVSEELSRIDRGFSFNTILGGDAEPSED
jgi:hypothetical protein